MAMRTRINGQLAIGTAVAGVILATAASSRAANVLFVDSDPALDASWQTLVESGGHSFTRYSGDYNPNLQAERDDINNNYDVIVVSGSNPNFNSVRANGANWNTLATPMVVCGNYLLSGQYSAGSWQWTTPTTGGAPSDSGPSDALDADDLVWTGVSLTPGTPPTVDLFDANAGHLDLTTDSLKPGIVTVAARSGDNARIAVAHAPPETVRAGSQEQYFVAAFTGSTGQAVPFSTAGKQVFLNAIGVLAGEIVSPPAGTFFFVK